MNSRLSRTIALSLVIVTSALSLPGAVHAGEMSSSSARGADSPVQAVRALLHGYVYTSPGHPGMVVVPRFRACFPVSSGFATCPLTARFRNRLQHADAIPPGCMGGCTLDPVSRAQNTTYWIAMRVAQNNGVRAIVNTRWAFEQGKWRLTYVVVRGRYGWQVDDTYCTGHPRTSIFRGVVQPCPGI
jgi:hypothetical protein